MLRRLVKRQRRAQNSLAEPQALGEPPALSPPSGWGSPQALLPQPENSPNIRKATSGEAKAALFAAGAAGEKGQSVPGPARVPRLGRVPGQRRLAQSPRLSAGPRAPGASLPDPSLELLAHLLGFFSMQKKPTPNPSDSAVYNLLAAGWLLGNCDGGSSRLVNAFQSAWQGTEGDFLWDAASWECQLLLSGVSGTSGVSTPTRGRDMGTRDRRGEATLGTCIQG